ncbi:bifunctional DNA primase/helicase [Alistipes sp.]|uniref:bifunctional DNA primase/helicase n=1 Tax=Alistipes sp. TaxID=1872444 RepID=UPI003AB2ECE1
MIIVDVNTKLLYEIEPRKQAGENYMTCPVCSATRHKKHDKCFCWNADKNIGHCNHCEASFVKYAPLKGRPTKEYAVPVWKNKTDLTDKAVKYFEGRMISQQTLRKMRIYSDREWMPQFGKEVEVMCFPYFKGGELRNIKYRGVQKSFKMVKDAELLFYNFDCIANASELIICEGEFDALTFVECGFENCVSVPNGAGAKDLSYLDAHIEALDHIRLFYIAADFDEPGLNLRNELVRRLGAERCRIVTYEGRKDANELLKASGGEAIHRIIGNAEEVPMEGVESLTVHYDDIYAMFIHGLPEGERIGIPEIDEKIRFATSKLAIWTGIPSHGKSEMLDFIVSRMAVANDWKTLYFSPENYPLELHYAKLASKITGKRFGTGWMTEQEFDEAYEFISTHFFWLNPYDTTTLEQILDRASYHVRRYGIKQLVIDPFNCLEHSRKATENGSEYIGRFLDDLSRFARRNDVLVHLVAHPAKMEALSPKNRTYGPPSLYDISGSANFYNKADYGLTVYRNFEECRSFLMVTKVRFRNYGEVCRDGIELQYNFNNGRYEAPKGDIRELDNSNWLHKSIVGDFPVGIQSAGYDDESCPF